MTHDSFALSDDAIAAFESEHGVTLRILRAGDAGSMVNQAILSRGNPLGDVLYGVDNTFLSRALDAEIFEPYRSPELAAVREAFQLDPRRRVTPIDYADVCLNIDRSAFAPSTSTPAPTTLDDLLGDEYRDQVVIENPATSSPGLAFLLATVERYGEEVTTSVDWREYWSALRDNGVLVADGWEDAYFGRFSGGSGEGDRPIVVSYASSPAAEVSSPEDDAPTAVVVDGCFRQIEFAGVLAGTERAELAGAFIDYLLTRPVQEELPLQMFVYPVRGDAQLPEVFERHAAPVPDPILLPYDVIDANRERWIEEWTQTVLN